MTDDIKELFLEFLKTKEWTKTSSDVYASIYVNYNDLPVPIQKRLLLDKPNECLDQMASVIPSVIPDLPEYRNVRIYNFPIINLRTITSRHINKFVSVQGIINYVQKPKPWLITATFICEGCTKTSVVDQPDQYPKSPKEKCSNKECKKKKSAELIWSPDLSIFIDSQMLSLQEPPEQLPAGQIPQRLQLLLQHDLVGQVRAGDIAVITGMIKIRRKQEKIKGISFDLFMEVNNVEIKSKDPTEIIITGKEEKKIKEMAGDPNIYSMILESFIPSIYGYKSVKEAIIYLLFGGVRRETPSGIIRGEINVLLIGDPACAKSQILKGAVRYSPRGLYTSGGGSSGVGLTAAVIKQDDGRFGLEAGAVVLGDKGVVAIDEMDKMNNDDRGKIHEAMEQQTVSIAKGGIVATLNARCAILGAANPSFGRYDKDRYMSENLDNFPPTLLSRFDLIFLVRDVPDEKKDKEMAKHILGLREGSVEIKEHISINFLKKYIAYTKRIVPILTEEAVNEIERFYAGLRKTKPMRTTSDGIQEIEKNAPIAITPRQLEALARISEAHARIALRTHVLKEDAKAAIDIMTKSLGEFGIDPKTGDADIDNMEGRKPKSQVKREQEYRYHSMAIMGKPEYQSIGITLSELRQELINKGVPSDGAESCVASLLNNSDIYMYKNNKYKLTSK